MQFKDIVTSLAQFYELAQRGGALTLEESYVVKRSISTLMEKGYECEQRDECLQKILLSVSMGQKKGCYSSENVVVYFELLEKLEALKKEDE